MPPSLDKGLDPQLRKILILRGHDACNDRRQEVCLQIIGSPSVGLLVLRSLKTPALPQLESPKSCN